MTGQLVRGRLRTRAWWRTAAVVVLLAVVFRPLPAPAQDDQFTATVTVDATADDVAKARDMARRDGQRKALTAVADKIAGGAGKAKLPRLSDSQVTDLVASFEVANEKMTAVRYTADYTYHFRPTETQAILASAGIGTNPPDSGTATAAPPLSPGAPPAPGAPPLPGAPPDNGAQKGPTTTIAVTLPIDSLTDWLKLRDRIAGLPPIKKIDVMSLSRQEATVNIQYTGTLDQLKSSLALIHLDLEGSDPTWRLARTP